MAPLFQMSGSSEKTIYIVFADKEGFADSLKSRIETTASSVIWVSSGDKFLNSGNGNFVIRVAESADYLKLFKSIEFSESPISVIDCWSLSFSEVEKAITNGVYHQIALAQAVLASGYNKTLSVCVISNQVYSVLGVEEINPAKGGITGLMKVLPQELPSFLYKHLDIDISKSEKIREELLVDITKDIFKSTKSASTIAYRHGIRWKMEYDQCQLPKLSARSFKHKGCYLITGGLGVLGLYLTEYLIKEYQASVIVTHYSHFPYRSEWESLQVSDSSDVKLKERINSLLRIEQYDGELSIKSNVDFTSATSVQTLFSELRDTAIDGIFHFAAVTDSKSIFKSIDAVEREDCIKVIAPKFDGLQYLANELNERRLDFCLVSSSLSSILGGLGFGAYATANALLDATVNKLNRNSAFPWICINFDSWKIGTDSIENSHSMSNMEGIEVVERIVGSNVRNQIIVSVRDLNRRILNWSQSSREAVESDSTSRDTVIHSRPNLSVPYVSPKTEIESILENIIKSAFGYDKVGADDDFFELGGDSLLAINVIGRIHKQLNVRILIKDFYNSPTIKGLANNVTTSAIHEKHKPIKSTERKEYYELSQIQMRIYIEMQLNASETHYNTPFVFMVEGKISGSEVESIFNKLVERHEGLRTSFRLIKGVPKQVVEPALSFRLKSVALDHRELAKDPEGTLRQIVEGFVQPFDLTKAPLVRAAFITLQEDKHVLLMDIHHIITDAISNKVLIKEIQSLLNNRSLAAQRVQYKDFCEWHNTYLANNALKNQEAYWLQRLSVNMPYTLLPSDFERTAKQQFKAKHAQLVFDNSQFELIQNFIVSKGITTYVFFLSVINILLSKYTNQIDITVGTETGGRNHSDLDSVVGMFVGLLALRNEISSDKTFEGLINDVKENLLHDYQNQDYQFSDLVKNLKLSGAHGRNPLFNIIVSMDNISTGGAINNNPSNEKTIRLIDFQGEKTIWDIRFGIFESEEKLAINIIYAAELFAVGTISLMTERITDIIQQVLSNPSVLIKDIQIKSAIRKQIRKEQLDKALDFDF
jgi:acyl carrier protein